MFDPQLPLDGQFAHLSGVQPLWDSAGAWEDGHGALASLAAWQVAAEGQSAQFFAGLDIVNSAAKRDTPRARTSV